jgi:hypothetical protein
VAANVSADFAAIKEWINSGDSIIQFFPINGPTTDNAYSGVHTGTTVQIAVTNGSGIVDPFNSVATVELTAAGGTTPKINGHNSPVLLTLTNGMVSAVISDTGAGAVTLGLQNGNTSLNLADTSTVTLS